VAADGTRIGIIRCRSSWSVLGATAYFLHAGRVAERGSAWMMPIIATGGFLCAEVGRRNSVPAEHRRRGDLRHVLPSALHYYHVLPAMLTIPSRLHEVHGLPLSLITAIIVGSSSAWIARAHQRLRQIFVPPARRLGARAPGRPCWSAPPWGWRAPPCCSSSSRSWAGGVGEGAIPLSTGYSGVCHQTQGDLFAQVLPPVMLGT